MRYENKTSIHWNLKLLACGDDVYDSTLAQCVPEHRITKDGRVIAVIGKREIDILPIYTTARVANKMTEFILKNGALALSGIWNADDDGVVNLNKINLIPGSIIPRAVGSKGFEALNPVILLILLGIWLNLCKNKYEIISKTRITK